MINNKIGISTGNVGRPVLVLVAENLRSDVQLDDLVRSLKDHNIIRVTHKIYAWAPTITCLRL